MSNLTDVFADQAQQLSRARIAKLEDAIRSVIDDELDRVSPGVKQELKEALGSTPSGEVNAD